MKIDGITNGDDAASTTNPSENFLDEIRSPLLADDTDNQLLETRIFSEPASQSLLSPPEYLSFNSSFARKLLNPQRLNVDSTTLPNSSDYSVQPGPSTSANLPGPSTSYVNNEADSGEKTDSQMRRLFRECESLQLLNDDANFLNEEPQPSNSSERNAIDEADTIHILSESSDAENEDNNDFRANRSHLDITSSRNYDSPNAEQSDSADHLFAPEESSNSSSENSQPDAPNPFLTQPSSSSYFKFLTSRPNSSVDDHILLRTPHRLRRFLRPTLSLQLSNEADRANRDSQLRLGSTQRLSSYLLQRSRIWNSRYRIRYPHVDPLSRYKTTSALNAVTSNDESSSLTSNGSDLRELNTRPYRRNLCLPKFNNESRFKPHLPSTELEASRYRHTRDRLLNSRSPSIFRSLFEIDNSLRTYARAPSNVRARSVSPTSANPNFSASVHDTSLDDMGLDLRSDSTIPAMRRFLNGEIGDQFPRPSTPLPPVLPNDDVLFSPMASNNLGTGSRSSCLKSVNMPQPLNLSEKHPKEAPRTYEELNNELIQLLECPICFEYSTPPINQCLQGHIICNNCRQRVSTCPTCRTMFQESRNLIMEKVAALLRYPCKNAVTGCLEFLYLLQKEQHEKSCGFRQYSCFIPLCNWRGYKPELLVHVQETHENHVVHGSSVNLLIPVSGQMTKIWLMSAFNELFSVIFFTTSVILKGCVRYIGDSSKCDSYTYNISVTSEEDMLRNFNYTRTTHAYEENFENIDMIDSYDLFSISQAQLNLFRKGTKAPIRVTVEEIQKRPSAPAQTS